MTQINLENIALAHSNLPVTDAHISLVERSAKKLIRRLPDSVELGDLMGKFDEPEPISKRTNHPGQIVRIDRNAVSADAGAGVERLKAKWLRLCRVDGSPKVDAQLVIIVFKACGRLDD